MKKRTLAALLAIVLFAAGSAFADSPFRHTQAAWRKSPADIVVPSASFSVELEDFTGNFTAEFLRISQGQRTLPVPESWEHSRYTYLADSGNTVFLACTDAGIWKLDGQSAERLSAAAYAGRSVREIREESDSLLWIDQTALSPDGKYAVYRSNRTDPLTDGHSVWALDTRSGEELLVLAQGSTARRVLGFLSRTDVLLETGSGTETRGGGERRYVLLNILTGETRELELSDSGTILHVAGVNGYAAVLSQESPGEREELLLVHLGVDGSALCLSKFAGYFPNGARFSPSGDTLAAPVAPGEGEAADDVLLIDISTASARRLEPRLPGEEAEAITDFVWAGESALLLRTHTDSPRIRTLEYPGDTSPDVTWLYDFAESGRRER